MEGFNQERRGLFDGLKVPFDVKAILLAAVGIGVFLLGDWTIRQAWPLEGAATDQWLFAVIAGNVLSYLGPVGRGVARLAHLSTERLPVHMGTWVFFFIWCAVVWSFFVGAICRIAAMKIAREESIELKDAVKFGLNKFFPNLFSIAFVAAIIGFFWLICNASIAGWVGRIPYVGDVLVAILFFLVLLSSFFIVFTGALGLLGFNLSAAAIATEASDTFDGVSRSWNYILARPWHVILTYGLTGAYIALFLFFGHVFLKVSVHSLGVRAWGMSHEPREFKPAGPELAKAIGLADDDTARLPGKAQYLYNRIVAKTPGWTDDQLLFPQKLKSGETVLKDVMPAIEGSLKFAAGLIWLWITAAQLLIYAYAVSYFLAAQTTVYFLLRKEVEGDDYTEINLEEDEEEDEIEYGDIGRTPAEPTKLPMSGTPLPTASTSAKPLPVVSTGGGAAGAGGAGGPGGEKKPETPSGSSASGGHSHGPGEKHDH